MRLIMLYVISLVLSCSSITLMASDVPGDWVSFGNNPSHTGYQPGVIGTQSPYHLWTKDMPSPTRGINQVVVAQNQVFVTPYVFYDDTYLWSLDASSGDEVWRYDFDRAGSMNPPSYADGNIYLQRNNGDSDSQLWSIDASTGNVNWSAPFITQLANFYAPTIANGNIWVNGGMGGGLYGFDQDTGEQLFFNGSLAQYDKWTPLFHEGRLYSWVAGFFREHHPTSGIVLNTLQTGSNWYGGDQYAVAVAENGTAYYQNRSNLGAIDLSNFTIKWQSDFGQKGTPAVLDDRLYAIKLREVQLYDGITGNYIASYQAPKLIRYFSQPILTDDKVIVSTDQQVFLIDRLTMELEHTIDEGGQLSLAGNTLYIAGNGKISAWRVSYHEKDDDAAPKVIRPIKDKYLIQGAGNITINLQDVFTDPDDNDDDMYFIVDANSNEKLVSATIIDQQLMLNFIDFPGEAKITIRANSNGKIVKTSFRLYFSNPDIYVELFNANGKKIKQGETVSGVITGKTTITNKMMQHAQFYENFRILHVNEHGHMIDSNYWQRTFSVDTSAFFDGENLISVHVHPMNFEGQPYLATFDVGSLKIKTKNNNPAPNGDTQLPTINIKPGGITVDDHVFPSHVLRTDFNAITINDDFGPIAIENPFENTFKRAQVIAHLGASVLGRPRWTNRTPPFAESRGKVFDNVHLINFQQASDFEARIVFFFNDDAGRANYGFYSFTMPAISVERRVNFPLPALDAEIINMQQGDEIILPEGESFMLQVKVKNFEVLGDRFPKMSTWIGNRVVAVTDLTPYVEALGGNDSSFIIDVEIPEAQIRALQNDRQGGVDAMAFAVWNDFSGGSNSYINRYSLPASEHLHASMIRTADHEWIYDQPTVEIISPGQGVTADRGVMVELSLSGDLSLVSELYLQLNNEDPIRMIDYKGLPGSMAYEFHNLTEKVHRIRAYFTDASGEPLQNDFADDFVTFYITRPDNPVYNSSDGEFIIPTVAVKTINSFGLETSLYYKQVVLKRASECSDFTYRVTSAQVLEIDNDDSLPDDEDVIAVYIASSGEVEIPVLDVINADSAMVKNYELVRMYLASNCSGLAFDTTTVLQ